MGHRRERQIDRGETPATSKIGKLNTFADLVSLHIADMSEVGKFPLPASVFGGFA